MPSYYVWKTMMMLFQCSALVYPIQGTTETPTKKKIQLRAEITVRVSLDLTLNVTRTIILSQM